jgi:peptidoglycan/LPS O-acetylase OafA/YrhL
MAALPPGTLPARRLDLEGLRGIAVLLVVCFHAGLSFFKGAFVAVDVFFVLSGFFLTTALAKRIATGEDLALGDLYARRVWRLLPALVVVVLATLASAMLFYAPIDRDFVAGSAIPVSLFAGNLVFAATGVNYFHAGENPFLHTWTLGVEWQLALLLPALVALLAAYGKKRAADLESTAGDAREIALRTVFAGIVIVGAVSFTAAVIINDISPMWAYFGPHTRMWAFASGAAMAFFAGGGQSVVGQTPFRVALAQVTGLGMLLGPAFLYGGTISYPGLISLVPVGGTLLLLGGGSLATSTPIGKLLAHPRLSSLGSVSYSFYLWHWPAMVLGGVLFPTIGPWGRLAFGVAAIWPARWTQRLLEGAVREKVMPSVSKGRPMVWALGVSGAVALVAFMMAGASRAYVAGSEHNVFAAARGDHMMGSCWASRQNMDAIEWGDGCAFGDTKSSTVFALLGDSHAEHWLGGLDVAGKANGWRIESHVMGACPAADFTGLIDGDRAKMFAPCLKYRAKTIDDVIRQRPAAVILSSSDYYVNTGDDHFSDYRVDADVWIEAMRATYKRLSHAGLKVIVLRDVPLVPFDVPSCLSRRAAGLLFAGDCTFTPDDSYITQARLAQNIAAFGLDIRFADMSDQVCPTSPCATMRGEVVVYTDDDHITATFARAVGETLGQRVAHAFEHSGLSKFERMVGKGADLLLLAQKYRWLIPANVAPFRFAPEL